MKKKQKKTFDDVTPQFTLKDIGSKIIDQLSTDVYTGAGSILRELVKNAYDAYLALEPEDFETGHIKRQIVISRERDDKGIGKIFIADQGIGQSLDVLKANVQISISHKSDELENATGFRGLGSWASLGAGSKITIISSRKGDPFENRLVIEVRRVYEKLSPSITLDDILNNAGCINISQRAAKKDDHFTIVEIECDGPVESVNGHEINRLYSYTDPSDLELKRILVQHCPIPFSKEGEIGKKIHDIYSKVGYVSTPVVFDGNVLERSLPNELSEFATEQLLIGGQIAAITWHVHNPKNSCDVSNLIEERHNLGGASIQLMKLNVPIGGKGLYSGRVEGLYSDKAVRDGILYWYVGEIHIISPDVQPNAAGNLLRDGTARSVFVAEMRSFYKRLEGEAEKKSEKISLERVLRNGQQAATKVASGGLTPLQKTQEISKVGKAVDVIQILSKSGKPHSAKEKNIKAAGKHPDVAPVLKAAKKVLKDTGLFAELTTPSSKESGESIKRPAPSSKSPNRKSGKNDKQEKASSPMIARFQSLVAQKHPKLMELGLTTEQIEGVFGIIQELFEGN